LGTPASVRAEVQDRIRRCGYNGGLVIASANVIMYDTPVENVVAMYEAAREFRWDDA
jgi:uroporphyrinogen decarboxylase